MFNREEGSTRRPDPRMTDTLYRGQSFAELPPITKKLSFTENPLDKLIDVYNRKALDVAGAPRVDRYDTFYNLPGEVFSRNLSLDMPNGERLAYASMRQTDDGSMPTYTIGHDLGDLNRDVMDKEYNTPLGTIGYGYEGNTDYLTFQPTGNSYIQVLKNLLGL